MLKGVMHIHSTYSDGEFTLAELREVFLAQECSFVCMTDHAEYFDEKLIQQYRAECDSLSDQQLRMIPGLEYRCERNMHILGYRALKLTPSKEPEEVIRHIDGQQALSVIAHPKDEFFEWIEGFATLPRGIETWNSKYDGQYAPRAGTFALLQRLKGRSQNIQAFYGIDLHWKKQFRQFFVALDSDKNDETAILVALAAGKYTAQKDDLTLPSSGILPASILDHFDRVHARSSHLRKFFKDGKKTLDQLGIRVPAALKSQLRRIF
jgi:predicted metal-dependent phosphoesterase TrpH